jgi:hypothetical protein
MALSRLLPLLAVVAVGSSTVSCVVEADPPERHYYDPAPPASAPTVPTTTVGIATGQTLASDGGQGAGVLVEYWGEGQWYVATVCDTFVTGLICSYDVTLALEPGASFTSVVDEPPDADGSNDVGSNDAQATLRFATRTETDGVLVRVEPPGAPLFVRATLDGRLDSGFLFWVDETGVVRHGSPTNPVWFSPTVP